MGSAERLAVIEQEPAVPQIQRRNGKGELFSDVFAEGEVERGVASQMSRDVAGSIGESRSVVQIASHRRSPGESEVEARVQRVRPRVR